MILRLDDPPQVFVARDQQGAWQVMVRIDGGYGTKDDAGVAAARLGRELRWMVNKSGGC